MKLTFSLKAEKNGLSEHEEQVAFVRFFRLSHPKHKIFAIPNGGSRGDSISSVIAGHQLKLEGVDRGVPDLFIPHLRLFIEMKSKKGTLSKEQEEYIRYLKNVGFHVHVAYSCEEAIQIVKDIEKLLN